MGKREAWSRWGVDPIIKIQANNRPAAATVKSHELQPKYILEIMLWIFWTICFQVSTNDFL